MGIVPHNVFREKEKEKRRVRPYLHTHTALSETVKSVEYRFLPKNNRE